MLTLGFHRVEPPTGLEITRVGPRRFRRLMTALAEAGTVPALPEAHGWQTDRGVALTFDDGFASVSDHALPHLRERGWKALVFLIAGAVGKSDDWDIRLLGRGRPMMAWDDVRRWSAEGMEFGSHTVSHGDLTALSNRALREELSSSKAMIEDVTGRPVRFVSYPFGRHNQRVREAAERAGYQAGFAARGDDGEDTGRFALPRRLVSNLTTLFELRVWLTANAEASHGRRLIEDWPGTFFQSLSAGSATVLNLRRWRRLRENRPAAVRTH